MSDSDGLHGDSGRKHKHSDTTSSNNADTRSNPAPPGPVPAPHNNTHHPDSSLSGDPVPSREPTKKRVARIYPFFASNTQSQRPQAVLQAVFLVPPFHPPIDKSIFADADLADKQSEEPEEPAEAKPGNMSEGFLQSLVEKLKSEIKGCHGRPDTCENGTFWHRVRDPVFALEAARLTAMDTTEEASEDKPPRGMNPRELYQRDVFIWLPGLPKKLPGELNDTIQSPPPGVRALHREDFLLTNRLKCNECGGHCQGTDPHVVSQKSRTLQESFPAYITSRAVIDKHLMSLMRPCFATRFGPKPFAAMLSELHHLDHAQRELIYLASVKASPTFVRSPEPFS
ncbi:hypothetical protein DFH09DRAFT_1100465 [Mycena vulgaris]|nr:hypothetical protein DFH09DRAFT_1100465 [Mycena vulgaris]